MSKVSIRSTLVWAILGIAASALPTYSTSAQEGRAPAAKIPCLCLYDGQYFGQGQCVCMATPRGPRLACCGKVLNNSSWSFLADSCPIADVQPYIPWPAASTARRTLDSANIASLLILKDRTNGGANATLPNISGR